MDSVFLILALIAGILLLGWLLIRKLPQLRMLDPSSLRASKEQRLKMELMRQRMERAGKRQLDRAQTYFFRPMGTLLQEAVRRFAGKLTAIERSYQKKRHAHSEPRQLRRSDLARMVKEGERFMEEEEWDRGEKRLIEVISHDSKHVAAYETLGRLYLKKKEISLARQTFQFLHKLVPTDASVIASLGEIAMQLERPQEAFYEFSRAAELRPRNPKYLDFLTQAAVAMGDAHAAQQALDRLAAVNPENQKIPEFEEKIRELREEIKTASS